MIFWKKPEPQEPFKQRQVTRVAYHYDDGTIEVFDVPKPTKQFNFPRKDRPHDQAV